MKSVVKVQAATATVSLPVRGAWIEIRWWFQMVLPSRSLPVRGAWIEMSSSHSGSSSQSGRSPCGERGLKCGRAAAPSRCPPSLPVRGAWIEINQAGYAPRKHSRRSPCGERGLKFSPVAADAGHAGSLPVRGAWIEIKTARRRVHRLHVAPRAGSVD